MPENREKAIGSAARTPVPEEFWKRFREEFPEKEEYLRAEMDKAADAGLRRNPLRGSFSLPWSGDAVPWEPNGIRLSEEARPGLHPYHAAGAYYLQEPSAMAPARLLAETFFPGARVADLCAAPGGKSTQLLSLLPKGGVLLSNDIQPQRAKALLSNLERFGAISAAVTSVSPERLEGPFAGFFSHILADAPCSGEGMFRKDDEARRQYTADSPESCHRRQLLVLRSAARLLRPGGVLVYSTCTFNREENEGTAARFLDEHPDFECDTQRRLWPGEPMGEGHFCCRFRKKGMAESVPDVETEKVDKAAGENFLQLFSELGIASLQGEGELMRLAASARMEGDYLTLPVFSSRRLQGLSVLRNGLQLAKVQKGRLIPAHALAMAFLREEGPSWEAGWEDAQRYLHGEAIAGEGTGYRVIRFEGMPLGWARGADGRYNNLLPKGLRSVSPYREAP